VTLPTICNSPIFIIGSPRSGTSILAWSLAQHSGLGTAEESNMFFELTRDEKLESVYRAAAARPDSGDWLRRKGVGEDEFLASLGLGLNALVTSRSDGRWIDQTPANTIVAPTLARLFPDAQFIHIVRDGRSVVNSMQHFAAAFSDDAREKFIEAGAMPSFATDFRVACETWVRYVSAALEFGQRYPDRCFVVRNEALRDDPVTSFSEMFAFLHIEDEPASAQYLRDRKLNSSFPDNPLPGGGEVPWDLWSESQRATFDEIAGPLLATLPGLGVPQRR
jgi:Sulfotransferase family